MDATSDIGIPTFYTTVRDHGSICRGGSGTSLNSAYALQRSVLEALQMHHGLQFGDAEQRAENERHVLSVRQHVAKRFQKFPAFLSAASESFFTLYDRGLYRKMPYVESGKIGTSVGEMLEEAASRLNKSGFSIYKFTQRQSPLTPLVCCSAIIPGLEDLVGIELGSFAVPGIRARQWLSSSAELVG